MFANREGRHGRRREGTHVLYWALVFLVVALMAGALGFGGVAGVAAGVAKILFLVFLVLFAGSLVLGGRSGFAER